MDFDTINSYFDRNETKERDIDDTETQIEFKINSGE